MDFKGTRTAKCKMVAGALLVERRRSGIMQSRINWSKITIKAIIAALLWSIVWSWLFSLMVKGEFVQVLPFGIGSGVIIGILLFFLMVVPYRIIAISVAFKDKEVFKKRLELAFSKVGYHPESGKSRKYERTTRTGGSPTPISRWATLLWGSIGHYSDPSPMPRG